MTAGLPRPSTDENISTTLSAGITDVATSFDVADASKIAYPCYLVIDRVDSAGTIKTSTLWEYIKVTNVVSNTLTVTRAQGGSTQQSHSSGAVVEAVITSSMFEDWYNAVNPEHTSAGGHVISTATVTNLYSGGATITSAGIGTLVTPTHLNVANASISGIGLNPTWYIPSLPSLASTALGRPMAMPRPGTLQFVSVTLNANISTTSVYFDVNKNFTSIFDAVGRPLIDGGTYVSTASIKTKNFKAGDVFTIDYDGIDLGGNNVDAVITLSSY
jgi:hypothetical protein